MRAILHDTPSAGAATTDAQQAAPVAPSAAARAGHWPAFDGAQLRLAQLGDARALGAFFDHYLDRIYAVAYRHVGRTEAAEDITQDVFFRIRRHLGRLDTTSDLAPWLYTVTVSACRDHLRSAWWRMSNRSVALDGPAGLPAMSGDAENPEALLQAAQEEHRIQAAVMRLPADLRTSVILHEYEDLPHEQIARITGTSHAAARKRHSRALQALASLLSEGAK